MAIIITVLYENLDDATFDLDYYLTKHMALVGENRSGGLASNRDHFEAGVQVDAGVNPDVLSLLFDPQTSGGLLIATASESADDVATAMERGGVRASRIGETRASVAGIRVVVRS